jgi:hypothetical protein
MENLLKTVLEIIVKNFAPYYYELNRKNSFENNNKFFIMKTIKNGHKGKTNVTVSLSS